MPDEELPKRNAIYHLYDEEINNWVEYHLKTNAGQVQMTTGGNNWRKFVSPKVKVNGVAFSEGSEAGSAEVTIDGTRIGNGLSGQLNYLSDDMSVSASFAVLDNYLNQAFNHIPSNVLTYGQGGTFPREYAILDQLEDFVMEQYLGDNPGFIRIKSANNNDIFFEVDETSYVPTTTTVNGNALTDNITVSGTQVPYGVGTHAVAHNTSITNVIDSVWDIAEGKNKGYGIDADGIFANMCINNRFNSSSEPLVLEFQVERAVGGKGWTSDYYLLPIGADANTGRVYLQDLNEFDNIYITDTDLPDRWLGGVSIVWDAMSAYGTATFTFYKLETTKVNLGWSNIGTASDPKPTTLAGYGISDAYIEGSVVHLGNTTLAAYIQNGTIHLGTDNATLKPVPYTGANENVDLGLFNLYAKQVRGSEKVYGGNSVETDGAFVLVNIGSIYEDGGSDNMYIEIEQYNGAYIGDVVVRAANMTFNNKNVATVSVSAAAPASPRVGDIWIKPTGTVN